MKQFDMSIPYKFRNLKEIPTIIGLTPDGKRIIGCYKNIQGDDYTVLTWKIDGSYCSVASAWDLINIPSEHEFECWVNVYSNGLTYMHESKDQADKVSSYGENFAERDRVACVHILQSYKSGEGL